MNVAKSMHSAFLNIPDSLEIDCVYLVVKLFLNMLTYKTEGILCLICEYQTIVI